MTRGLCLLGILIPAWHSDRVAESVVCAHLLDDALLSKAVHAPYPSQVASFAAISDSLMSSWAVISKPAGPMDISADSC